MNRGMRAGICLFGLGGMDLDMACRMAVYAGIRPVSIGLDDVIRESGGLDVLVGDPTHHGLKLRDRLSDYGLEPVELFMCSIPWQGVVTPTEPDAARREGAIAAFRAIARFAAAAGFHHVMGVPGSETGSGGDWERAWATLQTMADIARESGVGFTVEPHRGSLLEKPASAMRMAEEVPGLKYTLDYSHFHAQGISVEEVYPLHAHASHMHIKQSAMGVGKTLWHKGTVPYEIIIRKLVAEGWEGVLSSEYLGRVNSQDQANSASPADILSNPLLQNLSIVQYIAAVLAEPG